MLRIGRLSLGILGVWGLLAIAPTPISGIAQSNPVVLVQNSSSAKSSPRVFQAKIIRREGRTPVIQVLLDGQRFDMIVDTGANNTVITQEMAAALGVVPVKTLKFDTPTTKGIEFPLGHIGRVTVAGAEVSHLLVAIAGPELHTALLGQDFLEYYDVTFKQDVIEFRPR